MTGLLIILLVFPVNMTNANFNINENNLTTGEKDSEIIEERENKKQIHQEEHTDQFENNEKENEDRNGTEEISNQSETEQVESEETPEKIDHSETVLEENLDKKTEKNLNSEYQNQENLTEREVESNNLLDQTFDGAIDLGVSNFPNPQSTSSTPNYVLAKDSDFSGTSNHSFKYIGNAEYVEIPHVIKGVPVTSYASMFMGTRVKGVKSTNKNIDNMYEMFRNSEATELDLSQLDTSSVKNMNLMFAGSEATSINLTGFNTSNVTTMQHMFAETHATTLDLSSFDTRNVTNMEGMFSNSRATKINLSSFDTSNVVNMWGMFSESEVTILDLSSFDTSKLIDGSYMFSNSKATKIYARTPADKEVFENLIGTSSAEIVAFTLATDADFSGTSDGSFQYTGSAEYVEIPHVIKGVPVTSYASMFKGTSVKGVKSTNENVTNMQSMFESSQATELYFSSFNTSNVTNMRGMFHSSAAKSIDLSNFDTSNVTDMGFMFYASQATKGYARTQADAERLNSSSHKPDNLNFVVKGTPNIYFSENGSDTYKKSHSTKVTIQVDEANLTSSQYAWSTSESTPTSGWINFGNGQTISRSSGTGDYYLHVKATSSLGITTNSRTNVFKFDNTEPTVTLYQSPTEYTNSDVKITVSGIDSHSGVKRIQLPNGNWVDGSTMTYTATANGTYSFRVEDHAGNISTKSITVNNIDKTAPTISLSQNGGGWAHLHFTTINASDSGGSGLKSLEYRWTTSSSFPTDSFTAITSGNLVNAPESTGDYYLHVKAIDNVGNVRQFTSNVFKVDLTEPGAPTINAPTEWQNQNISVTITPGVDDHSGVNHIEYQINDEFWTMYNNAFTVSTNGETTIQAITVDKVFNTSDVARKVIKIDKINPTLTITPSTTSMTHHDVILTIEGSDEHSGVKRIQLPNGDWVNEGSVTYNAKYNGTYQFTVEDYAGNSTTESFTIDNIDKTSSFEIPILSSHFGNLKLGESTTMFTANIDPVIIKDWRDTTNEWSLRVSATRMKLEDEAFYLPVGTLGLKAVENIERISGSGDMPVKKLTAKSIIDNGQVAVVESTSSRGEYHIEFPNNALEITIDPITAKAGKYESTVTWEFVNAP